MASSDPVVVLPSLPRLLGTCVGGGGGVVGGLFLVVGPGTLWFSAIGVVAAFVAFSLFQAVVSRRPRLEVDSEGFTLFTLFGRKSRRWDEVDGEFAVVRIGWTEAVGYNLAACRRPPGGGEVPKPRVAGCDDGVSGAFGISATGLAKLLNERLAAARA